MNLKSLIRTRPEFVDVEVTGIAIGEDQTPLVVRVFRPDRKALAEAITALPGDRPDEPTDDGASPERDADELAERLVAQFAHVQVPGGEWICPAFSFADPPDPELIDGRDLTLADLRLIAMKIMSQGGYLKRGSGESAPPTFLGQ